MPVSKFHELQTSNPSPLVKRMAKAPKFVFTEEVMGFIENHFDEYGDALNAAVKAGHMELPHNPMVVEWGSLLSNSAPVRIFWLVTAEGGGHYRLTSIALDRRGSAEMDGEFPIEIKPGHWRAGEYTGVKHDDDDPDLLQRIEKAAWRALFYAMALHVRGIITKPAAPVDPALERARAKRRLPPVTKDYVTVHIGYVTDREGNRHDYREGVGRHVRVHLRRGHVRNQACGPSLQDRKEIWIDAMLINWQPSDAMPDQPDYLVVP
jgi:hypothetical protein